MFDFVLVTSVIVILLFAFVVLRGAPYLPTLKPQIQTALDELGLQAGQTLLELGSGDGRMLRAAAERGIYSVGYELNPLLVVYSKLRHWRYRAYISVKWADFWQVDWPPSDGMYVFLLDRFMKKLDTRVARYARGKQYSLVSFGFKIPDKKSKNSRNGLYVYTYN